MLEILSPSDPKLLEMDRRRFLLVQDTEELSDAVFQDEPVGFFREALVRFCRSKVSIAAFAVIALVLLFAVLAPELSRYDFNGQSLEHVNLPPKNEFFSQLGMDGSRVLQKRRKDSLGNTSRYPEGCILSVGESQMMEGVELCDIKVDYYLYAGVDPGTRYWIGTDYLGRDLWVRMWRGARISLAIAFASVICNVFIGIVYGSIAGYYGGKLDMVMMRITEIIGAFPEIVVVTLFILFFGTGMISIILALVVQNWIGTARMVRGQFYRYKGSEYVLAARTLGVKDMSLIFRHILPNSIGPIITRATIAIPSAIFTESFLAYIGLGIRAPESSIGVLLAQGQKVMLQFPNQVFFPAALISVLMFAFNMLSNGLRDAFDPTQRGT
jgi:oligopeptide transport system permease protein